MHGRWPAIEQRDAVIGLDEVAAHVVGEAAVQEVDGLRERPARRASANRRQRLREILDEIVGRLDPCRQPYEVGG